MNKELILDIVEDSVSSLKFDLIECNINYGKTKDVLKIIISHRDKKITSDDCTLVADVISRRMDIDDPFERAYDLVVESPGLERELKTLDELPFFVGKELKFFISEESSFVTKEGFVIGRLEQVIERNCTVKIDGKLHELNFDEIKKAKLYCDFDKLFKKK